MLVNLPLVCKIKFSSNLSAVAIFRYKLKFLNLHELGLLNLKFILVRKAKFSPKFNYIDFIFLKNLSVVVKKFLSDRAYWI